MNLSLHSSFPTHLDYVDIITKNITTACWRWITYLLPNDKRERARVNLWFHKTFHDELEMWLISENNKGNTEAPLGTSTLLRKALKVALFKWTELVSLRSLMMQNSTGEFAGKSEKEDTAGQILLAFVVSNTSAIHLVREHSSNFPEQRILEVEKLIPMEHIHVVSREVLGMRQEGQMPTRYRGLLRSSWVLSVPKALLRVLQVPREFHFPFLPATWLPTKTLPPFFLKMGLLFFTHWPGHYWSPGRVRQWRDPQCMTPRQVPGAGQVLCKCWGSATPAKSMQNHQAFVCVWVGLHKH